MRLTPQQQKACDLVNKYFRKLHLAILRRQIKITDRDAPQKS